MAVQRVHPGFEANNLLCEPKGGGCNYVRTDSNNAGALSINSELVAAEGNLYSSNDTGETTVFKADPAGFKAVAKNMLDELIYASPAISGGALYIRTESQLYCIRASSAGAAKPEAAGE